jgi:hypothetical protein
MPHLFFRGLSVEQIRTVSRELVEELAELCECPRDYLTLECLQTTAVFDGEVVPSYPFVEVAWFDRGSEIRHRFASILDRHIRSLGVAEAEIAFRVYLEDHYYINGAPAGAGPVEETASLRQELQSVKDANVRLREQLAKTARKPAAASPDSAMSSRLRDALRE